VATVVASHHIQNSFVLAIFMSTEQGKLPTPARDVNDIPTSRHVTTNVVVKNFQFHSGFHIMSDSLVINLGNKHVTKARHYIQRSGKLFKAEIFIYFSVKDMNVDINKNSQAQEMHETTQMTEAAQKQAT